MLQLVLQPRLLLRGKLAELRVVFERAALLRRRQILIAAEPVSGVPGLILRRTNLIGAAGARTSLFLKVVPLSVRRLRLRMLSRWRLRRRIPVLGERGLGKQGRQQQKRCQTARNFCPAQHASVPFTQVRAQKTGANLGHPRYRSYIAPESHGFAVTSSCTCRSSSTSKSAYNSSFLSSACRSPTAVPGCTGRPSDGGLVAMASV